MKTNLIFFFLLIFSKYSFSAEVQSVNYLDTGISKLKLGLLLQNWAIYDEKNVTTKSNFRLRRAEIKLSGSITEKTSFILMLDPSKSLKTGAIDTANDNKVLQDFILNYTLNEHLDLTTGQFKIPTSAEGLVSSSSLLLPERSMVARTYGDKRELGIKLTYKKDLYKIQTMISSGTRTNTDDSNTQKDIQIRGDLYPIKNLNFGFFSTLVDGKSNKLKYGANLFWEGGPVSLHFELGADDSKSIAGVKKSRGYIFDAGYMIDDNLQGVVRYEKMNFFRTTLDLESTVTTLGVNYFIKDSNAKIQFSSLFLSNMTLSNGSYDVSALEIGNRIGYTVNFQFAF